MLFLKISKLHFKYYTQTNRGIVYSVGIILYLLSVIFAQVINIKVTEVFVFLLFIESLTNILSLYEHVWLDVSNKKKSQLFIFLLFNNLVYLIVFFTCMLIKVIILKLIDYNYSFGNSEFNLIIAFILFISMTNYFGFVMEKLDFQKMIGRASRKMLISMLFVFTPIVIFHALITHYDKISMLFLITTSIIFYIINLYFVSSLYLNKKLKSLIISEILKS